MYPATSGATETPGSGTALQMVYNSGDHTYRLATQEEIDVGGTVDTVTTDDTGLFNFAGLDEGTYYLEETVAPPGYNLLENRIKIVVKVLEQNVDATGTAVTTYKITVDNTPIFDPEGTPEPSYDGTNDVVNHKGATLPETGGIGTTIFYVVGSVLVLAAVILLVTKRRMKSE